MNKILVVKKLYRNDVEWGNKEIQDAMARNFKRQQKVGTT